MEAFLVQDPAALLDASAEVTSQLVDSTGERTVSLLPTDLQTTNFILDQVVDILEDNVDMTTSAEPDEVRHVLEYGSC